MMTPIHNTIITPLKVACLSVLLLSAACERETPSAPTGPAASGEISFSEVLPEGWNPMTRSVDEGHFMMERSEQIEVGATPDGTSILMYVEVEDGISPDPAAPSYPVTRADDLADDEDMGLFSYWMWKDDEKDVAPSYDGSASEEFIINNFVDVADNYKYSPVKYWPGYGYWLKFFAYRPYIDAANSDILSVTYRDEDPELNNDPKLHYTASADLDKHIDLQAAQTGMIRGDATGAGLDANGKVRLDLNHVLSKVRFKVGTMYGVNIENLTLKNINSKGVYDFNSWTASDRTDYVQNFGKTFFPAKGDMIGKTMFMVPQVLNETLDAELYLKINFPLPEGADPSVALPREPYEISRPLKDFTSEWEENKTYTYVITTPEEVSVLVKDKIEGNVKKDLEIWNDGLATVYIRVALIGAWVIKDPTVPGGYEIVNDWEADKEGDFVWGDAQNVNNWRKQDGFYYYMKEVPRNTKVEVPLFQSYTLTAAAPVLGAQLKLNIIAQAIHHEDAVHGWPPEITLNYPPITTP